MSQDVAELYTWELDSVIIWLRYFLLAGLGYLLFYVLWRKHFFFKKIQKKKPPAKIVRREILYSMITLSIYCATSYLAFLSERRGLTRIYPDIQEYGYGYFFASIAIMVLVHDTYFYWTHRLMHHPLIFQRVHRVHHLSTNPTPWAAFSFHPLEAIISVGIIPIFVFLIPSHPYALFLFLGYMTLVNVLGHLGYELFSINFRKSKIGKWQNTATNHNIHHQFSKHNFGLYFTLWDRLMKTLKE